MAGNAILAVSFGTSHADTREKTIDRIEEDIQKAYPDDKVYRAWTSKMIIKKIISIYFCKVIISLLSCNIQK